ncbi:MAG: acylphosphatase [Gemmataceae bacterium]
MNDHPPIARQVRYSGQVQGVGFRATTWRIAQKFAVTGWVRNLPDGRVELWAEGHEPEVQRFLQAIRDCWRGSIQNEEIGSPPAESRYCAFDIAH